MSNIGFLEYLGLDDSADERAIKRAYAVLLKKIDQESDPDGFQMLRGAYEAAQQWARCRGAGSHQESENADAAPRVSTSPVDVEADVEAQAHEAPIDPGQLAAQVHHDFLQRPIDSQLSLDDAKQMLYGSLDDVRLMNLEARVIFEWLVARQLLEGWRPGHEVLFVAAIEVFQWAADRSRLMQFGPLGARIEAALSERDVFMVQAADVQQFHAEWIRRMRIDGHPGQGFLAEKMSHVEMLVTRLPNWLWIITRLEQLESWRDWAKSSTQVAPLPAESLAKPSGRWQMRWWYPVVLMIIVLRGLASLVDSGPVDSQRSESLNRPVPVFPSLQQSQRPQTVGGLNSMPSVVGTTERPFSYPPEVGGAKANEQIFTPALGRRKVLSTRETQSDAPNAARLPRDGAVAESGRRTVDQDVLQPYMSWDVIAGRGGNDRKQAPHERPEMERSARTAAPREAEAPAKMLELEAPSLYELRSRPTLRSLADELPRLGEKELGRGANSESSP